MSTVVAGYPGAAGNTVLLKGAFEQVVSSCNTVTLKDNSQKALSAADKKNLITRIKGVAAEGYRVLGFAIATDGGNMKNIT